MANRGWGSGYQGGRGGRGGQGGQSAWGSGFRSGQSNQQQGRGRGRGDNRFEQLSEQEDNERAFSNHRGGRGGGGGGGGRGRGRQGRGGGQPSWRETVQFDDENERPPWRLTSYAHERGEPSDLSGDTSFEELRWQQLQAARSGTPAAQIQQQYMAAVRAKQQQWEALLKAQRPPSKGGPDIPVPDAAGSSPFQGTAGPFQQSFQQQPQQPAAAAFGQQQPAPPFGQPQQPAAPAAAFGQGAAASRVVFGQAAQPAAAFGSSVASAPGFNSGLAANPFGTLPSSAGNAAMPFVPAGTSASPFGSTAAAAPASFGAAAASRPNAFGFGSGAAAPTPAQQQQQQGSFDFAGSNTAPAAGQAATPASVQPGSLGSGPGFGQSMMAAAVPTQPLPNGQSPSAGGASSQQVSAAAGGDLAIWQAPTFTKGKIPEEPPPPALCV